LVGKYFFNVDQEKICINDLISLSKHINLLHINKSCQKELLKKSIIIYNEGKLREVVMKGQMALSGEIVNR